MRFQKRAALAAPLLIATSASALAQQVSGNAFNPAVSLILDGHFASYSQDPKTYRSAGFLARSGGRPRRRRTVARRDGARDQRERRRQVLRLDEPVDTSRRATAARRSSLEEAYFETTRAAERAQGEGRQVLLRDRLSEPGALARVGLLRRAARLRRDAEHAAVGHGRAAELDRADAISTSRSAASGCAATRSRPRTARRATARAPRRSSSTSAATSARRAAGARASRI